MVLPEVMAAGSETRASNEKAIAAHMVPTAEVIFTPRVSRKLFALVAKDKDLVMIEAYSRRLDKRSDLARGGVFCSSCVFRLFFRRYSLESLTFRNQSVGGYCCGWS